MIKVSDAINVFNTLYSLKSEKFSGKVSYAIDKNLNALAKYIIAYESDVYKLGAEISGGIIDPESNTFKIPEERQSEIHWRPAYVGLWSSWSRQIGFTQLRVSDILQEEPLQPIF